jgi:bifunctional non-homologous end joining protein LigD
VKRVFHYQEGTMNTEQQSHIELEFREGSSDKVYRAAIEKADGGFVVNFAYGRRGATLNTGTKTTQPVTCDEAAGIYEKLVRSKTAKGYKPVAGGQVDAGIGSSITDREQRDTGLRPQLLNPITENEAAAYLDDDNWCAQEKFDGKRMLLRKSGREITAANRNGLSIGFPDTLVEPLSRHQGDFVLDGESVGETLFTFDLLEDAAVNWRNAPYKERFEALQSQFGKLGGNIVIAKTAFGEKKREFMAQLKKAGKEGIVFKDLRASWSAGRPATGGNAIKCKFWATCSCVVAKVNAQRSVEIALGGKSVGNVTIPPNHGIPAKGQVVEIRYLYVAGIGGSLYQPIYLGIRDDVSSDQCTVERQRLKYKSEAA